MTVEIPTKGKNLLESAPPTLRRVDEPTILTFEFQKEQIHPLGEWRHDFRENEKLFLERLQGQIREKQIQTVSVSAEEMLKAALEIPKSIYDTNGFWFSDLPHDLVTLIAEKRFGRAATRGKYDPESPVTIMRHRSERWTQETCRTGSLLWEMGIIIEGADGRMLVISFSIPWENKRPVWYKKLTAKEIFVGRKDILEDFSFMTTGKSQEQNMLERAINADESEIWWGQAILSNPIIRGRYEEVDLKTRPGYSERVLSEISPELTGKGMHEFIRGAKYIRGYFISAREGKIPNTVTTDLFLDEQNWLEPYPKTQKTEPAPGTYEYKKKNEPPARKMWVSSLGLLANKEALDEQNPELSVFIGLNKQTDSQGEVKVTHLKIDDFERGVSYFFNSPAFGDAFARLKRLRIHSEKDTRPLKEQSIRRAIELFKRAKVRAEVDSETYWNTGRTQGFSPRTISIIQSAEALLQEKLEKLKVKYLPLP